MVRGTLLPLLPEVFTINLDLPADLDEDAEARQGDRC